MRTFETGATRDNDTGKYDYEAFLSPAVIECYAEYMHKNRVQRDGQMRPGDNWQKGIPLTAYMKSMWRHFFDVWKLHRGLKASVAIEEALCAVLFNAMGYLHEVLKAKCEIDRCVVEQNRCAKELMAGNDKPGGARLGLQDWVKEEVLLLNGVPDPNGFNAATATK